ncbi:hypothetical protein GWI33_019522 [Rhynchophorus ferrugineus]|uniref:Uncharacterized protein n=1 Tax=Rhynchophorus ferrugineus TaxID=354439 RepID=A0A834M585_RHYFE|nr:hypothetical protein GWI33_019522 [Rhynchophorus ferrugineus]
MSRVPINIRRGVIKSFTPWVRIRLGLPRRVVRTGTPAPLHPPRSLFIYGANDLSPVHKRVHNPHAAVKNRVCAAISDYRRNSCAPSSSVAPRLAQPRRTIAGMRFVFVCCRLFYSVYPFGFRSSFFVLTCRERRYLEKRPGVESDVLSCLFERCAMRSLSKKYRELVYPPQSTTLLFRPSK